MKEMCRKAARMRIIGKHAVLFLVGYDRSVPKLRQADHCTGCNQCSPHCPQTIDIPQKNCIVLTKFCRTVENKRLYKNGEYHYILHKGGYSCVMKNREEVRTFTQRGVADLYDLYQADSAFMKGAAIADKVIGKGAAALMVLGGFKTVYADIISTPALALLCEAGIETTFAQEVPHIINRDKTGWCPLETACMELNTVEEMYPVIQNFYIKNQGKNSKQPALFSPDYPDALFSFQHLEVFLEHTDIIQCAGLSLWSFR